MTSIAILEAVNTSYVPFNGQQVLTTMAAGIAYVAMRPIVENIGLDWAAQFVKLKKQSKKFGCCDIATPSKGGIQKMLCIPLKKLNGWLFSINPEKVRADIRDKLIQYQEECFTVLHDYWTKGNAENPRKTQQSTAKQLIPLRQTAERLIATGMGRIYPDIWKFVHQHFEIEHINQLKPSQISEAVTYLDALEGEFLGKQQSVASHRYHYPVETADPHNRTFANDWISAHVILDERNRAPELELLEALEKDGNDVTGAKIRIHAMYGIAKQFIEIQSELSHMKKYLVAINDIVNNQTVERGMNVCFTGNSKGGAVGGYTKRCLPR
ncbi:phage antirepressor N-terminal domain-containing protein [Klebsiella pneumoniae]|uniref:phage antirepressor N-terminal domain-containing protein n=1 Tax=Klebsiella pneumoniae TaxID=573 RepID=UPI001FAD29C9|nr:phage antirepressor N-terminal domain-containing protein [Klebsiella pneumoniae]MCI8181787.1 phage antirepressor N-terminal domain-containing protein [Klebsiella pneumoniae]WLE36007.1 phage antirepressor N-terminal domain-containing protein [Klebsiella pneumoniae]